MSNDPIQDARVPDLVVILNLSAIYPPAGDPILAAHGGFSEEDTHVALLVSNPKLKPLMIKTPVETTQIAPTILKALGLNPRALQAVEKEETSILPGLF